MVIHDADRVIARRMFQIAVGMVAAREEDPTAQGLAKSALDAPSAMTIRALVAAGRDKPWLPSVIDALAQVGIAAAEDVLGGHS